MLGAGDAFSAGFLSGWVRGEDYGACTRYANACGALVVSRHGCAPAMPTRVELDYFLANAAAIPRPDHDATLTRLHRVTAPRTPRDEVFAFAFDHRNQFFELAQRNRRGRGAAARAQETVRRSGRGDGERAPARRAYRHPLRRSLRTGRAERRDGTRLVDRAAGRIAGFESGRVRSRPVDRHHIAQLAGRAHREVPRRLPPGRRVERRLEQEAQIAHCTTRCRRAATSCCSRSSRRAGSRASRTRCCAR